MPIVEILTAASGIKSALESIGLTIKGSTTHPSESQAYTAGTRFQIAVMSELAKLSPDFFTNAHALAIHNASRQFAASSGLWTTTPTTRQYLNDSAGYGIGGGARALITAHLIRIGHWVTRNSDASSSGEAINVLNRYLREVIVSPYASEYPGIVTTSGGIAVSGGETVGGELRDAIARVSWGGVIVLLAAFYFGWRLFQYVRRK